MQELVAAGERGVLVRVLLDKSFTVLELDEFFAKEVKPSGVEIRYYNSSTLAQISTTQFRNHRKLLVVDGKEALTGGRNIGDDYFDLSAKFNFNDADVYLTGPIVKTLKASFEKFFNHKIAERPTLPEKPLLDLRDNIRKERLRLRPSYDLQLKNKKPEQRLLPLRQTFAALKNLTFALR
jgi:putative cardiolipin synthase